MKKLSFITLCILGLYSCNQQRPAVIERPIYDKQGKQLVRYVDFPGVDAMKREIEKGLLP